METELDEARSRGGTPERTLFRGSRDRHHSVPASAERFGSASKRGRDRAMRSPSDPMHDFGTPPSSKGLRRWLPFQGRRKEPTSEQREGAQHRSKSMTGAAHEGGTTA